MKIFELQKTKSSNFCNMKNEIKSTSHVTEKDSALQPHSPSKSGQRKLRLESLAGGAKQIPDALVEALVKYGNNSDGIPPLLYAAKMGDLQAVKLLIEYGADPLARDFSGNSALYFALISKNSQLVKFFLDKGLDPNDSNNKHGNPVWSDLTKLDDAKSFNLLIEYGLDLKNSRLILHSIGCGSLNLLKLFLSKGVYLNREEIPGYISLDPNYCGAPGRGREKLECLKWLASAGILDLKNLKNSFNISGTYPEFLEYIIDNNLFQVNQKINEIYYPIHLASEKPDLLRVLISRGADISVKCGKDGYGRSVLHCANLESAKLLLENGADVNGLDDFGRTPLFYANDPMVQRLLIEYGGILKGR